METIGKNPIQSAMDATVQEALDAFNSGNAVGAPFWITDDELNKWKKGFKSGTGVPSWLTDDFQFASQKGFMRFCATREPLAPAPFKRWLVFDEREHFLCIQTDCEISEISEVAKELLEFGLSTVDVSMNPMRGYKLVFTCQKLPNYTGTP